MDLICIGFDEDDLYRAPEFFHLKMKMKMFIHLPLQFLYGCFCYNGKNIKNPRFKFAKPVLKGRRFDMPDSDVLPKEFKKMITKCWSQKQSERGTMEEIKGSHSLEDVFMEVVENERQV